MHGFAFPHWRLCQQTQTLRRCPGMYLYVATGNWYSFIVWKSRPIIHARAGKLGGESNFFFPSSTLVITPIYWWIFFDRNERT